MTDRENGPDPTYRRKERTGRQDPGEAASAKPDEECRGAGTAAHLFGQVGGFRERSESEGAWTVWTFRLDRYDEAGNRRPPVAVEMTGTSFSGFVQDGDEVEIQGVWYEGGLVRCERLLNHTMDGNSVVAANAEFVRGARRLQAGVLGAVGRVLEGRSSRGLKWFVLFFLCLFLGLPAIVFALYVIVMWSSASNF